MNFVSGYELTCGAHFLRRTASRAKLLSPLFRKGGWSWVGARCIQDITGVFSNGRICSYIKKLSTQGDVSLKLKRNLHEK